MTDNPTADTETEPTPTKSHAASHPGEMAQPDSDRLPDDELLSLYRDDSSHGSSYLLRRNLARALQAGGIAGIEYVDVVFDDEDPDQPALAILPLDPDETEYASNARKVSYAGDSAEVRVPPDLLGGGDHPGGIPSDLGLALDDYDNENKLLFEPVIGDGFLLLLPVRWEAGDPYVSPTSDPPQETNPETDSEADDRPQAAGVPGEALDVPVSRETLAETAQSTGVDPDALQAALAAVDDAADDVSWQTPVQYQPLEAEVDGRDATIHIVPESVWRELAAAARDNVADADLAETGLDAALEAAELVHVATAREAIERAGTASYRHFEAEHSALVK